jgi:hypothetical protein
MARGWESKSIESQIESAREDQSQQGAERSEKEKLVIREQQNLLLSRSYVQRQLDSASNERYAHSLRQALAEIDQKLSNLQSVLDRKTPST